MTSEEAVIKNRAIVAGMPSSGSDGSEKELRFRSFLVVAIDQWLANRTLIAEGLSTGKYQSPVGFLVEIGIPGSLANRLVRIDCAAENIRDLVFGSKPGTGISVTLWEIRSTPQFLDMFWAFSSVLPSTTHR